MELIKAKMLVLSVTYQCVGVREKNYQLEIWQTCKYFLTFFLFLFFNDFIIIFLFHLFTFNTFQKLMLLQNIGHTGHCITVFCFCIFFLLFSHTRVQGHHIPCSWAQSEDVCHATKQDNRNFLSHQSPCKKKILIKKSYKSNNQFT